MGYILITGSSGFIGSNLYQYLINNNFEVFGVDLCKSKYSDAVMDLTIYDKNFEQLVNDSDLVIHLAASVGVDDLINPKEFFNNSYNIDYNVLNLCKKYNKKIIYTSTSEVYGDCIEANEDSDFGIVKNSDRTEYAVQKLNSEFFIKNNFNDYIILRPFNIIGQNQNKTKSVFHKFIEKAKNNEHLIINYDPETNVSPTRQFCLIDDFCEYVKRLIVNNSNGIYNIGNPNNEIKIRKLAELIVNLAYSQSLIIKQPWKNNFHDIVIRSGNFDKIQKETNFYPKYNLEKIITRILMEN